MSLNCLAHRELRVQKQEVALNMTPYFAILITLFSSYLLYNANGQRVSVLKLLNQGEETATTDLRAAAKLVQGLDFQTFNDKIACVEEREILLANYPTVIENFASRFSVPPDVKESLLDAQYVGDMVEIVKNFKFENGELGRFVYGRVATIKDGDRIDMAYLVYTLDFKLAPTVIKHKKKKRVLGITVRKKVWYETKERNLSTKEKEDLSEYLTILAVSKLRSVYHKHH